MLSERLWQPLGMLGDADLMVDEVGTPFAGGGLNLRLEDFCASARRSGTMARTTGWA